MNELDCLHNRHGILKNDRSEDECIVCTQLRQEIATDGGTQVGHEVVTELLLAFR